MEQREEQKQKQALVFRAAMIVVILCLLVTCAVCGIIARYKFTRVDQPDGDVQFEVIDDDIGGKEDDDKPTLPPDDDGDKPEYPGGKPDGDDDDEEGGKTPPGPNPPPDEGDDDITITIIITPPGPPDLSAEFDIFEVINEEDCVTDEEHVSKTEKIIAPGTGGTFDVRLANVTGDAIEYVLRFEEVNDNGIFIQYSLDGEKWYDDMENMDSIWGLCDRGQNLTETVYWRWCYEGTGVTDSDASLTDAHVGQTDEADTELGNRAVSERLEVIVRADLYAWYR